ncbi:SagB family peptide dehydrogenase [Kitasatospora sp. NPDC048365]|uniref:SagB/ThcOx family dehydrogenase n=1 Tax=Kitasatospora sp. NPDC048365 TaxID=3364050 RepID=UPI0037217493
MPRSDASLAPVRLVSLREDTLVEQDPAGDALTVVSPWGELRIERPGRVVRESLRRMGFGPVSLENVPGSAEHRRLAEVLEQLHHVLVHSVAAATGQGPLLSLVPVSGQAALRLPAADPGRPHRLSRFAALAARPEGAVLESPLALHRVLLHHPDAVALAAALTRPATPEQLAAALGLPAVLAAELVAHLTAAGTVVAGEPDPAGGPARFAEDSDPVLGLWAEADLLFHTRSRLGRHDGPYGAVFPHGARGPAEPAVKPPPAGPRIALHRPAMDRLLAGDRRFTAVLEAERPAAEAGPERPPTAEQLGELLYRAARVRSLGVGKHGAADPYPVSDRPYPSTGSLYELELYVVVGECPGLPRGIHHYDPLDHRLTLINRQESDVVELLGTAQIAAGLPAPPPVLITLTARFGRTSWIYRGMAYAATLRHVGVVQQTLSLVATAMGLTPHPVAFGDIESSARAFGLDWRIESSVGEFVIGAGHRGG